MDPESLKVPVQGASDLQACYDHALAGLLKAGTELDRVGTELDRAQITFYNAVNEYFNQLQLQIDNKDKTIRLLMEQKIETYDAMYSMRNQLADFRDEKTMVNTKNENVLPWGTLQENFLDNVPFGVQDRTSSSLPNGTNHSALIDHTLLNCGSASISNGGHGRKTSETVPYRAEHRDLEMQHRDDEVFETRGKSTKHTSPEEIATRRLLRDSCERQAAVPERSDYSSRNLEAGTQDVVRQAQERLRRNPASAPGNGIISIVEGQIARERFAEWEEAPQYVSEAWQKFSVDTSLDATRAFLKNNNFSNVLAGRPQLIEIEESHRGPAAQDTSHNKSQPQGLQQQDLRNPYDQQQRAEQLNAVPWAKYKQGSTTEAMESFRRQQAAHSWTATTDDRKTRGSSSNDTTKAIQPAGREPRLKAELQSPPSKDQSVSVLNPRSPSFVPSNDEHQAAMIGRKTPPHKRLFKSESLNATLNATSTSVSPIAFNSDPRNDTTIPPHKRFQVVAKAHKASPSIEADIDLIALEDEIDPVTATHQYKFKATARKDQTLASLDPNKSKPLPTVPKGFNGVACKAPGSSSLNELRELRTEAISFSPSYNAPLNPGISVERPSQVWHENMFKQPHDSSGPRVQYLTPSTSLPVVENGFGAIQALPSTDKPKVVPVQRKSTLVLAPSPVKSETNDLAHSVATTGTGNRVFKTSPTSKSEAPFKNKPPTMGEHKIDARTESEAPPPTVIASRVPTPTPPQDFSLPKDNKAMSAAFMAAAHTKFSAFATKYGRDPESDTRKELAAKGKALREKLASEASTSNVGASLHVPEDQYRYPDEQEYDRPTVVGTHVLGEVLDPQSKHLVLKPNSRGEWFEINLEWNPVVKDGTTCYILW